MTKTVQALSLGRLRYGQSLKLQKLISDRVKEKKLLDTLVIVEHDPVYTVGIRDKSYSENDEKKLKSLGAEFFRTNRGGLITFHGPGQMVVYPIIDLRNFDLGVRCYVHTLEKTIIDLCATFGLKGETSPYTGVWVNDQKICALGIHASRFVTTHGLALNCNTDLKWFSHIVPCGIQGKFVTSLSEQLNRNVGIEDAVPKFKISFSKLFCCEIVDSDFSEDLDLLKIKQGLIQVILGNSVVWMRSVRALKVLLGHFGKFRDASKFKISAQRPTGIVNHILHQFFNEAIRLGLNG